MSLSTFCHEFRNEKFDDQPVEDAQRRAIATVKVGSSKSSTNDFIRVRNVTKTLGSFVMFVLPVEIEERRHVEGSKTQGVTPYIRMIGMIIVSFRGCRRFSIF